MAATDTIAGELNSLSTATVIDFYKRWFRTDGARRALPGDLARRRPASGGSLPARVAVWAAELGSLIEVVNRFGSFFYGSILGVFILAIGFPRGHRQRRVHRADRRHGVGRAGSRASPGSRSSGTTSSAPWSWSSWG